MGFSRFQISLGIFFLLYHRSFWTWQKLYGKILERYGLSLRKKYIYQNHNFFLIYLRDWNNLLNKQEWQFRENVELLVWLITPWNNTNNVHWDQKHDRRWIMLGHKSGGTKVFSLLGKHSYFLEKIYDLWGTRNAKMETAGKIRRAPHGYTNNFMCPVLGFYQESSCHTCLPRRDDRNFLCSRGHQQVVSWLKPLGISKLKWN